MNSNERWTNAYRKMDMPYPSEYVIRIFKGRYPKLDFYSKGYSDKSILDVSCGIGRNFPLFAQLGFGKIAGTEITQEIVDVIHSNCQKMGIEADVRVGNNENLGFESESFDFLLAWNVCYYLNENKKNFEKHIVEYARVLKKGGVLVFSIPCEDAFIYDKAIKGDKYLEITNDWFKGRNGTIQRYFKNEQEIEEAFGEYFKDFVFGKISDDCFGLSYKWHIGYCIKK